MTDDKNKSVGTSRESSRFSQHLMIMGIENPDGLSEVDVKSEADFLSKIEIPDLALPAEEESESLLSIVSGFLFGWQGATILVAAFLVLFFVYPQNSDTNNWRTKGGGIAEVFYKLPDGKVEKFTGKTKLENGTRIQVKLTSANNSIGYLVIVNESNQMMIPMEDVVRDRIELAAGKSDFFVFSFELEGESEGETVIAVECDAVQIKAMAEAELSSMLRELVLTGDVRNLNSCDVTRIKLR